MRQLLSKFEPKAKRQRVEVLMDVFRNSTNCEHHKSLLSELSAILYNKDKTKHFRFFITKQQFQNKHTVEQQRVYVFFAKSMIFMMMKEYKTEKGRLQWKSNDQERN